MLIQIRHQGVKYTYTVPENSNQYCWTTPAGERVSSDLSNLLLDLAEEKGINLDLFNNKAAKNMKKAQEKSKIIRAPVKLFDKDNSFKLKSMNTSVKLFE